MIMDAETRFSNAQAITADAASTNVIDTGTTKDVGPGEPLNVSAIVTTTFTDLTSIHITLQTDTVEAFSSPTDLVSTGEIPLASLVAGYEFPKLVVPNTAQRYLRLHYDCTGTDPTAGAVTAGIVFDQQLP